MSGKNKLGGSALFLLGSAFGGLVTYLFTPHSKKFRDDISTQVNRIIWKTRRKGIELVDEAKNTADDLVSKAKKVHELSRKYAKGEYTGPMNKIEKEINSLRAAIRSAIETYKGERYEAATFPGIIDDIFKDAEIDFEEEALPKHLSMRRRRR